MLRPPAPPDRSGEVVDGRYSVEALLGSGGFGAIYSGFDLSTGEPIAIKFLHTAQLKDSAIVSRFHREARHALQLKHPNTVRTYDAGVTLDSDLYIAMELLEGEALTDLMRRGLPLEPDLAIRIAIQICASLQEAHGLGIVHRDLKPDNIFLQRASSPGAGPEGTVRVLDFGLAKSMEPVASKLTATGIVVGSPVYLSPEQANPEASIDGRADLYAVGVLLFLMLTGGAPFSASNPLELVLCHLQEPPPDIHDHGDVPDRLAAVVMRLLRKDPDTRYASAGALMKALRHAAEPSSPEQPAPPDIEASVDIDALVPVAGPPPLPPGPPPTAAHSARGMPPPGARPSVEVVKPGRLHPALVVLGGLSAVILLYFALR